MSSPIHRQANGKAESAVKIVKQKCLGDHSDQYQEQHNIPRQDTGLSSAKILFGRSAGTLLLNFAAISNTSVKRENIQLSYDRLARDLSKLESGQSIHTLTKSKMTSPKYR